MSESYQSSSVQSTSEQSISESYSDSISNSDSDYDTSSITASTYVPETVYSSDEDKDSDLDQDSSDEERKKMIFTPKRNSISEKLKEKQLRLSSKTRENINDDFKPKKSQLSTKKLEQKEKIIDIKDTKDAKDIKDTKDTKDIKDTKEIKEKIISDKDEIVKEKVIEMKEKNDSFKEKIIDDNELPEDAQKSILKDSLLKGNFRDKNIIRVLNEWKDKKDESVLIFKSYWGILLQSKKVSIDLSSLCFHFPNSIFHAEKNMLSIELEQPTCLFTITNRGKIMISGCNSKESLINGTKKLIYLLREIGFTQMEYTNPTCMNIIGLSSVHINQLKEKFKMNHKTNQKLNDIKLKMDLTKIKNEISLFELMIKNKKGEMIKLKPFHFKEMDSDTLILECQAPLFDINETISFTIMIITLEGKIGMFAKSLNNESFSFQQLENYHNWILNHFFNFIYDKFTSQIKPSIIDDLGNFQIISLK